ncbi:MAG: hypothetical protein IJY86_05655 [Clostridia bacterium]|nr:hypothetical protein [Clostridia bacterium]
MKPNRLKKIFIIILCVWIFSFLVSGLALSTGHRTQANFDPPDGSYVKNIPPIYRLLYSFSTARQNNGKADIDISEGISSYLAPFATFEENEDGQTVFVDIVVTSEDGKVISVKNDISFELGEGIYGGTVTDTVSSMKNGETKSYKFTSQSSRVSGECTAEITLLSRGDLILPELTNGFVKENTGYSSSEEFTGAIFESMTRSFRNEQREKTYRSFVDHIVTESEYVIDAFEFNSEYSDFFESIAYSAVMAGVPLEDQISASGYQNVYLYVRNNAQREIVTEYYAQKWNISPKESEIEALTSLGYTPEEAEYILTEEAVINRLYFFAPRLKGGIAG